MLCYDAPSLAVQEIRTSSSPPIRKRPEFSAAGESVISKAGAKLPTARFSPKADIVCTSVKMGIPTIGISLVNDEIPPGKELTFQNCRNKQKIYDVIPPGKKLTFQNCRNKRKIYEVILS